MYLENSIFICIYLVLLLSSCNQHENSRYNHMAIDTTSTLYAFYPNYDYIKWTCSKSPNKDNKNIIFCCTATFSKDYSIKIDHNKICGSHIVDGKYYEGYQHCLLNGAFVYSDGIYAFLYDSINIKMKSLDGLPKTYGFSQMRLDTNIMNIPSDNIFFEKFGLRGYRNLEGKLRLSNTKFKYRALCEKESKLCVIESKEKVTLTQFRKNLKEYGVTHALYLDTGIGWSHAWYRDNNNKVQVLHPYIHPFNTNWLIFYKDKI